MYACQTLNQTVIPGNSRYIDVLPQDAGQWSGTKRPAWAPSGATVFVRGFDFGTTQEQLESHMGSVGTVTNINMTCKGSAEVTYSSAMEAAAARQQLNNTTIPGNTRYIDVKKQEDSPNPAKRWKSGGEDNSMMMGMMQMLMQLPARSAKKMLQPHEHGDLCQQVVDDGGCADPLRFARLDERGLGA